MQEDDWSPELRDFYVAQGDTHFRNPAPKKPEDPEPDCPELEDPDWLEFKKRLGCNEDLDLWKAYW